jgi:hypothetical protein
MSSSPAAYTSSISLLILGKKLEPAQVSAVLELDSHDSWKKGQTKRVGVDVHQWGGWKRDLPHDLKEAAFEDQLNYWINGLLPKVGALEAAVQLGTRGVLDCFVSADAAWFKLSPEVTQRLAKLPLDIEFTFWSAESAA